MTIAQNFPNLKPSLSLDFANTKALDPRITFNRASTATYYGTETAKAEENLLIRSQEFDNAFWGKDNIAVAANATTAPDGTTTAESLVPTVVSAFHRVGSSSITLTANVATHSVFVKANGYSKVVLREGQTSGAAATFDLSTGTVIGVLNAGAVTVSNNTITDVGNDWYRISCTFTGTTAQRFQFYVLDPTYTSGTVVEVWTPDGTSGVFLWGAQLEQRDSVTAYTPTTTQPITNYIPVLESAASGVARFDHNPVTKESLGLLIEEQRTNLLLRSEEFDNAAWTKTNATITANTIVAPNGELTGDKLVENTETNFHVVSQTITLTQNASFAISVYAKFAGRDITLGHSGVVIGIFNLTTGVATLGPGNVNNTALSVNMTFVGNGWYRCTAVFLRVGVSLVGAAEISLNGRTNYTGDGFSGAFLWGAQFEQGSAFPTSYIPTVASQVTRAADAASMTGANFSSWYNQGEGTLYAEFSAGAPTATAGVFSIDDNTASNQINLRTQVNNPRLLVNVNGVSQVNTALGTMPAAGISLKLAGCYKFNDFAVDSSVGDLATNSSGLIPNVNTARIGSLPGSSTLPLNGHISKISYYPVRVTNEQLQGLTT